MNKIRCQLYSNSKQNLWDFHLCIIQLNLKSAFGENMEEEYGGRFERINGFWPQVDQQSSHSDLYWNQNQNQSASTNRLVELYRAKQRFRQFIDELGQLKKTAIRDDVLRYCEAQGKKQKSIEVHYKPETILKKIQVRIQKMIKTKRIKRNWGQQDIKILLWIISKYCDWKEYINIEKQLGQQDWKFVATLIPGVTAEVCMFKWLSLKKITLSTNCWSQYESNLLSSIVRERNNKGLKHNSQIHDWKQISQELYRLNLHDDKVYRNAKQCREHWTCYLSPQLKKGPWQLYEDVRLLKFIQANNGLKKWSEISKYFEGRTQNALKNRYTLIVDKQRKLQKNKHKSQLELVSEYLQKCYIEQYTSQKQQDQMIYQQEQEPKKEQVNCEIKYYPIRGHQTKQQEVEPEIKKEDSFEEIFQDQDSGYYEKGNHQLMIDRYPQSLSGDSNNGNLSSQTRPITPMKVQIFKFKDLEKIGMENFLKHTQLGVIDSNGKFKKVDRISGNDQWKSSQNSKQKSHQN